MNTYTLRQAVEADIDFLFLVSTSAMQHVHDAIHGDKPRDLEKEFVEYKEKFKPEAINIVQFEGKDVGRLRVVRSSESIYIGGLQLLPEYQGKGIGSAIMFDLIQESEKTHLPILLEVHHVNKNAYTFYIKVGFETVKDLGTKWEMKYVPKSLK